MQPLVLAAEEHHRFVVQAAQQLGLPFGPGARADRLDVGGREDVEHLQHFGRAEVMRELHQGFGIGNVAAEGDVGHLEMPQHEPGHDLGRLRTEVQALRDALGDFCSDLGVRAAEALADVVQDDGQMQDVALLDGGVSRAERAGVSLERRTLLDGLQRMLVDSELVVLVELHQGPGVGDIRNEHFNQPGFVHAAQQRRQRPGVPQDVHEHRGGRLADFARQPRDGTGDRVLERPAGAHAVQRRGPVNAKDADEVFCDPSEMPGGGVDFARADLKDAVGPMREEEVVQASAKRRPAAERGKPAGRMDDHLGVLEVPLHEDFDGPLGRRRLDAHAVRDAKLLVAGQAVLGLAGGEMQIDPDVRQELPRFAERDRFIGGKLANELERIDVAGFKERVADPADEVQVAEASGGRLDVGLEFLGRRAFIAFRPAGEDAVADELLAAAVDDAAAEAAGQRLDQ